MAALGRQCAVAVAAVIALSGCGADRGVSLASEQVTPSATPTATSSATSSATPKPPSHPVTPTPSPLLRRARQIVAAMTLGERTGQLIMIATSPNELTPRARRAIEHEHVGAVNLMFSAGTNRAVVRATARAIQRATTPRGSAIVATDQEGGAVQRLKPPGFSAIPSATEQGKMPTAKLQAAAERWGRQLASAGVNLDLAPVLDVVPGNPAANAPIGFYQRNYGSTPSAVSRAALAVISGLAAAGVNACGKHFPGLGTVRHNTDYSSNVTDRTTTANSALLDPYRDAIRHGMDFMMLSSATYSRIDPGVPAVFSHRIVTGLLKRRLHFNGVIVSDDLGNAQQLAGMSPGARAVRFISAGGDLVMFANLVQVPTIFKALKQAQTSPAFSQLVTAAATKIVEAKLRMGLLK